MDLHKGRRGFTLVELLAVIAIILILIAILIPVVLHMRERGYRVKCANNLRQLGAALHMYAADHREYPRTGWVRGMVATAFMRPDEPDPFRPRAISSDRFNSTTMPLFLLLRGRYLTPEILICPSTNDTKDTFEGRTALQRSDFSRSSLMPTTLSYSWATPYPGDGGPDGGIFTRPRELEYKLTPSLRGDFVLAADRNDGVHFNANEMPPANAPLAELKQLNSRNHKQVGQNVLRNDGSVRWEESSFVGIAGNNIYRTDRGADSSMRYDWIPSNRYDTVLLPMFPLPINPIGISQ